MTPVMTVASLKTAGWTVRGQLGTLDGATGGEVDRQLALVRDASCPRRRRRRLQRR